MDEVKKLKEKNRQEDYYEQNGRGGYRTAEEVWQGRIEQARAEIPHAALRVKRLSEHAVLPTVNHPGEDLGYDLYASEDAVLYPGVTTLVRTGIAVEFAVGDGGLIRDRSSKARDGLLVTGGVIDAGYRGEISVLMTNLNLGGRGQYHYCGIDYSKTGVPGLSHQSCCTIDGATPAHSTFVPTPVWQENSNFYFVVPPCIIEIKRGDKIAQLVPIPVLTGNVAWADDLSESARGEKGFGSSGR